MYETRLWGVRRTFGVGTLWLVVPRNKLYYHTRMTGGRTGQLELCWPFELICDLMDVRC